MGNDSIFDNIYNEGLWGVDSNGISTSGVGSHSKDVINPYEKNNVSKEITGILKTFSSKKLLEKNFVDLI